VDDDLALGRLAALPGVAEAIADARQSCARLRWHPALRRQTGQARAEATARAARASAALEGADLPLSLVRELLMGTRAVPTDAVGLVAAGAVRATGLANTCGRVLREAPAQVLARLHLASAAGLVAESDLGRPRSDPDVVASVTGLSHLLAAGRDQPAVLVAALAHGQVLAARPFAVGSAVVARAVFRAVSIERGLDPTGVCLPEVAWAATGTGRYAEASTGYLSGTPDGVADWLRYCADAVTQGAREGERVCAAVLAGRLAG
jgi:hypothetical protein